jgi:hypothetical protein
VSGRRKLQVLTVAAACAIIGVASPAQAAQAAVVDVSADAVHWNIRNAPGPYETVEPGTLAGLVVTYTLSGYSTSPTTVEIDLPEGFTAREVGFPSDVCQILLEGRKVACVIPRTDPFSGSVLVGVWVDDGLCPGTDAKGLLKVQNPEDSTPANNEVAYKVHVA